ncbi:putative inner membrane domain protein, partial [Chlamydia psittaci 84-8471/1]
RRFLPKEFQLQLMRNNHRLLMLPLLIWRE